MLGFGSKTTSKKTASKTAEIKTADKVKDVTFEFFAPKAKKVSVSGSFNDWLPENVSLKKGRDGKWQTQVPLAPGRYEYRFVVDGNWENDQKPVECVSNPFGTWNCVLKVD